MSLLWFIIGIIVGAAIVWYFLDQKCKAQLAERDREVSRLKQELSSAKSAPQSIAPPASAPKASPAPAPKADKPAALAAVSAPSGKPDDLTKIKGIGPVLKGKLEKLGITTFQQVADFTPADIERINGQLSFQGRIEREKWIEQAKALAAKG